MAMAGPAVPPPTTLHPWRIKMGNPPEKEEGYQTIRDWNVLPDSLISSAELSDDCVSKFTSLVRARD